MRSTLAMKFFFNRNIRHFIFGKSDLLLPRRDLLRNGLKWHHKEVFLKSIQVFLCFLRVDDCMSTMVVEFLFKSFLAQSQNIVEPFKVYFLVVQHVLLSKDLIFLIHLYIVVPDIEKSEVLHGD